MGLSIQLPSGQSLVLSAGTDITGADIPFLSPELPGKVVGHIDCHPDDPSLLKLKNLSKVEWIVTTLNGDEQQVAPGRSLVLIEGVEIDFGFGVALVCNPESQQRGSRKSGQETAPAQRHSPREEQISSVVGDNLPPAMPVAPERALDTSKQASAAPLETIEEPPDQPRTVNDELDGVAKTAAEFGRAWQDFCHGQRPSPPLISDFVNRITPQTCQEMLIELVSEDNEYRRNKYRLRSWSEYLRDFPQLASFHRPKNTNPNSHSKRNLPPTDTTPIEIRLGERTVLGREMARGVTHLLEHPRVSRRHTLLEYSNGVASISDLGSTNGTFVNGQRIDGVCELQDGATIDIGPFHLTYSRGLIRTKSRFDNIEIAAIGLRRTAISRETKRPIVLLDDVSLVVRPREFVCIIGGAGSGKSTLLKTLSCRAPTDSGQVLLNGTDLSQNFHALKSDMAVVQQKDILLDSLTIRQSLNYTASLRLPADMYAAERMKRVDEIIDKMHLTAKRDTQIKYLSGGQIKRVSLANELLSDPSLIFLDEVTSGLDEATDRDMMILFREIADAGKTILCVTHSLAHVEDTCTHVAVLAPGGILAFYGTPDEALNYFGVKRLGEIYLFVKKFPDRSRDRFRSDKHYVTYVSDRLPEPTPHATKTAPAPKTTTRRIGLLTQAWVLLKRYARIQLNDYGNLAMTIGQPIVVAILMNLLFGRLDKETDVKAMTSTTRIMFVLSLSAFWFGCSNSAKEIAKERRFYERERDADLSPLAYLISKWVLLGLMTVVQSLVLVILVKDFTMFKGDIERQLLSLTMAAITGMSFGLLISTASKSENQAQTTVPIMLIPQVLFAGVLVPLSSKILPLVKAGCTNYWSYAALVQSLNDDDFQLLKRMDPNTPSVAFNDCLWGMFVQAIVVAILTRICLAWQDRVQG